VDPPKAVGLVCFDSGVREVLAALLADEGYTMGADTPDVVLVEAGCQFAARSIVEGLGGGAPIVLLVTSDVAPVPSNVRAVVAMPFDLADLLGTVSRAVA
jgi:hypothetical protein